MSLVVEIESTDRASLIKRGSLSISNSINQRTDTCEFVIEKHTGQSFTPSLDDEVTVELDSSLIFGGTIIAIKDKAITKDRIEYSISCIDYNHQLNREIVTERYEDKTIDYIIADLITNYTTGFTGVAVDANITVESIAFNRLQVSQCIKKLADQVNYNWYVDYEKDIHFFAKNAESAPFNLTDDSDNYIFSSLSISRDLSQIRNKILVEGGEVVSSASREAKHAGNGEQDQFDTNYKFATEPVVEVDGVAQTVGLENISDDASYECMWSYKEKYIRFTAGNVPPEPTSPATTNVSIEGDPLFPILVNVPAPVSIGLYGVYQHSIKDRTIKTREQATDRAIAEIQAFASQINKSSFQTYTIGLKAGQIININSTIRGIDEDFVIQRVRFSMLSNDATYPGVWTVELATLKDMGIIELLQQLLLDEEIEINEEEILLSYLEFNEDTITITDGAVTPTTTTGPYKYNNVAEDYNGYYSYSTYA